MAEVPDEKSNSEEKEETLLPRTETHLPSNLQNEDKRKELDEVNDEAGTVLSYQTTVIETDTDYNKTDADLRSEISDIGFDMSNVIRAAARNAKNFVPKLPPLPTKTKIFIYSLLLLFLLSFVMVILLIVEMVEKGRVAGLDLVSALIFFFASLFGVVLIYNYRSIWVRPPEFIADRVTTLRRFDTKHEMSRPKIFGTRTHNMRRRGKSSKQSKKNLEQDITLQASLSVTGATGADAAQPEGRERYENLLEAFMSGDFLLKLYECDVDEVRTFLPIIAQTIANLPFGLTKYKYTLARVLARRIGETPSLDQAWRYFLHSSRDIPAINHFWSGDTYLQNETIENDPVEHFNKVYEYFNSRAEEKGKEVSINKILDDKSDFLYDPISGNKLSSVRLVSIMKSNAKPLVLDLICKDAKSKSRVLLKKGDDLRKDSGVTLMFHIMNAIWRKLELKTTSGILIEAKTYQCIPFDSEPTFGLIEFIAGCTPLRQMHSIDAIQKIMTQLVGQEKYNNLIELGQNGDARIPDGASDTQRSDTVASRDESEKRANYENMENQLKEFRNKLIATAAGSYIASYVLGVRDRHSNNILINETDGTLFHIDFGYIMGEVLPGMNIDAPPFAITYDLYKFIAASNEGDWQRFITYCVDAFEHLRRHHMELLDYVKIAFSFLKEGDKLNPEKFLSEKLMIDRKPSEAIEALKAELLGAPNDWRTPVKNRMNQMMTKS